MDFSVLSTQNVGVVTVAAKKSTKFPPWTFRISVPRAEQFAAKEQRHVPSKGRVKCFD